MMDIGSVALTSNRRLPTNLAKRSEIQSPNKTPIPTVVIPLMIASFNTSPRVAPSWPDPVLCTSAYESRLLCWKNADPDIPILRQAKAEYAKLK